MSERSSTSNSSSSRRSTPPLGPEAFKPQMSNASLHILLPNFNCSRNPLDVSSTRDPVSNELRSLTEFGITLYNERRFLELAQSGLLSPDLIKINQDGQTRNSTVEEHMPSHEALLKENPNHHSKILDITVDVDERKRSATTFALLEVTGFPSTLCRQTISVVKWKRNESNGQWQIANVSNMRGTQGFS